MVQGLGLGLDLEGPGLGLVLGYWILASTTTLFITNIAAIAAIFKLEGLNL